MANKDLINDQPELNEKYEINTDKEDSQLDRDVELIATEFRDVFKDLENAPKDKSTDKNEKGNDPLSKGTYKALADKCYALADKADSRIAKEIYNLAGVLLDVRGKNIIQGLDIIKNNILKNDPAAKELYDKIDKAVPDSIKPIFKAPFKVIDIMDRVSRINPGVEMFNAVKDFINKGDYKQDKPIVPQFIDKEFGDLDKGIDKPEDIKDKPDIDTSPNEVDPLNNGFYDDSAKPEIDPQDIKPEDLKDILDKDDLNDNPLNDADKDIDSEDNNLNDILDSAQKEPDTKPEDDNERVDRDENPSIPKDPIEHLDDDDDPDDIDNEDPSQAESKYEGPERIADPEDSLADKISKDESDITDDVGLIDNNENLMDDTLDMSTNDYDVDEIEPSEDTPDTPTSEEEIVIPEDSMDDSDAYDVDNDGTTDQIEQETDQFDNNDNSNDVEQVEGNDELNDNVDSGNTENDIQPSVDSGNEDQPEAEETDQFQEQESDVDASNVDGETLSDIFNNNDNIEIDSVNDKTGDIDKQDTFPEVSYPENDFTDEIPPDTDTENISVPETDTDPTDTSAFDKLDNTESNSGIIDEPSNSDTDFGDNTFSDILNDAKNDFAETDPFETVQKPTEVDPFESETFGDLLDKAVSPENELFDPDNLEFIKPDMETKLEFDDDKPDFDPNDIESNAAEMDEIADSMSDAELEELLALL